MKISFLGTSAGSQTPERNVSGIVLNLLKERRKLWLFDCGESSQVQMQKMDLSLSKLEVIFITHLHGDHVFGLPGVLTTRSLMQNQSPLTLIGPKGIKQFVETVIELSYSWLTYALTIIELDEDGTVFEDETFCVQAKLLAHRVPSFGYRVIQKSSINRQERKVAILGDTVSCQASIALADNVDLLVHEATQSHALEDKASSRGHSTTIQAAEIALKANAKKLIITHISPRYKLSDNETLINECKTVFANTEMAIDFATFDVD